MFSSVTALSCMRSSGRGLTLCDVDGQVVLNNTHFMENTVTSGEDAMRGVVYKEPNTAGSRCMFVTTESPVATETALSLVVGSTYILLIAW